MKEAVPDGPETHPTAAVVVLDDAVEVAMEDEADVPLPMRDAADWEEDEREEDARAGTALVFFAPDAAGFADPQADTSALPRRTAVTQKTRPPAKTDPNVDRPTSDRLTR